MSSVASAVNCDTARNRLGAVIGRKRRRRRRRRRRTSTYDGRETVTLSARIQRHISAVYLESFADVASPGAGERRHGPDGGPEPGDADEKRRATRGHGVEASQRLRDDFVAVDGDQRQRVDRVESADSRHKRVPLARCRRHRLTNVSATPLLPGFLSSLFSVAHCSLPQRL